MTCLAASFTLTIVSGCLFHSHCDVSRCAGANPCCLVVLFAVSLSRSFSDCRARTAPSYQAVLGNAFGFDELFCPLDHVFPIQICCSFFSKSDNHLRHSLSARHDQHGVHICNRQLYTNTHALQLLSVSGIVVRFVTSYFLGKSSSRSIAKEPLIAHCLNFSLGQSAWYTPSLRWTRLRLKNATLSRSKFRLTQQQTISSQ